MINFRPPYLEQNEHRLLWMRLGGLSRCRPGYPPYITWDMASPGIRPIFVMAYCIMSKKCGMAGESIIATDGEQWTKIGWQWSVHYPPLSMPCIRKGLIKRIIEDYVGRCPDGDVITYD